jgi:hypothetical protein
MLGEGNNWSKINKWHFRHFHGQPQYFVVKPIETLKEKGTAVPFSPWVYQTLQNRKERKSMPMPVKLRKPILAIKAPDAPALRREVWRLWQHSF